MAEVNHQQKQHSRSIEGLDVLEVEGVVVVAVKNYFSERIVVLKV